jgi:hypothetical protein
MADAVPFEAAILVRHVGFQLADVERAVAAVDTGLARLGAHPEAVSLDSLGYGSHRITGSPRHCQTAQRPVVPSGRWMGC